jgi:hypothetical protein
MFFFGHDGSVVATNQEDFDEYERINGPVLMPTATGDEGDLD